MAGLYIHIPFCKKKCPYCSFYSIENYDIDVIKKYLNSILLELNSEVTDQSIDTIYVGGGTPSIIPIVSFESLLIHLRHLINFSNITEFTVEINPESATEDLIKLFHNYGVNRISLGVQSFDNDVLYFLGRIHTSHMIFKTIDTIMKHYDLENVSIDLIYDIPLVSTKKIFLSLEEAVKLGFLHISAYNYSLENNYLQHFYSAYNEQITHTINYLEKFGYEQYEISNFCRYNKISLHNIKYWLMDEYIGIGASAHSMFNVTNGRLRRENVNNIYSYIKDPFANRLIHNIDLKELIKEDIIFGLRYLKGINIYNYIKLPCFDKIYNEIDKLIYENLIYKCNYTINLTKKGVLFYDLVASRLWNSYA